jgi:hypothetical protein
LTRRQHWQTPDLKWPRFWQFAMELYPSVPLGAREWAFEAPFEAHGKQGEPFEAQGKQGKELREEWRGTIDEWRANDGEVGVVTSCKTLGLEGGTPLPVFCKCC